MSIEFCEIELPGQADFRYNFYEELEQLKLQEYEGSRNAEREEAEIIVGTIHNI